MTSDREFHLVLEHRGAGAGGGAVRWGWVHLHWPLFFDFNVWCGRQRHVKGPRSSLLKERNAHSLTPWFPSSWSCIFPVKRWGNKLLGSLVLGQSAKLQVKEMWSQGFMYNFGQIHSTSQGFCFPNYKMEITPASPWMNTQKDSEREKIQCL